MNILSTSARLAILTGVAIHATGSAHAQAFTPGDLVVSSSTYVGTATTVAVGANLPGGGKATNNGALYGVFNNSNPDGSFGVTSPLFLTQYALGGTDGTTSATAGAVTNLTALTGVVTSFASKSEGALNLSQNGQYLTLIDYASTVNQLDISNSNTPGITEPGNYTGQTGANAGGQATAREVVSLNSAGQATAVLPTNAYPGNNGRAAVQLNNGTYILAGNAGNANGSAQVTAANGIQVLNTATDTVTAGAYNTTKAGSSNGAVAMYIASGDKASKDDNFRGLTVFNNTVYTTKGSGSNGINTVYQVGTQGQLPDGSGNSAITILPGFPTTAAKTSTFTPFGLFFADANTLYVTDEGTGKVATPGTLAVGDLAAAASDSQSGIEKWSLKNGTWVLDYTLQAGLGLGSTYSVNDGLGDSITVGADGLRNITGKVNADGTVSLYAITSTISGDGDLGADPNQLVAINDLLSNTTAAGASGEHFTILQTAAYGQVLRGVAFAPVPEPAAFAVLGAGVAGLALVRRRRA